MFSKSEWKEDIYCVSGLKKCSSFVKKNTLCTRKNYLGTDRLLRLGGGWWGGGGYNFLRGSILGGQF